MALHLETWFNQLYEERDVLYQHRVISFKPCDSRPMDRGHCLWSWRLWTSILQYFFTSLISQLSGVIVSYTVDYRMLELKGQRDEKSNGIYYRFQTTTDRLVQTNILWQRKVTCLSQECIPQSRQRSESFVYWYAGGLAALRGITELYC